MCLTSVLVCWLLPLSVWLYWYVGFLCFGSRHVWVTQPRLFKMPSFVGTNVWKYSDIHYISSHLYIYTLNVWVQQCLLVTINQFMDLILENCNRHRYTYTVIIHIIVFAASSFLGNIESSCLLLGGGATSRCLPVWGGLHIGVCVCAITGFRFLLQLITVPLYSWKTVKDGFVCSPRRQTDTHTGASTKTCVQMAADQTIRWSSLQSTGSRHDDKTNEEKTVSCCY